MKVWVMVDRKKAILAGKNEEGWKLIEVDMGKLSQEEREYVASCRDGYWEKNEYGKYLYEIQGVHAPAMEGRVAEATEDEVILAIREQIVVAGEEKRRAEEKAKLEADARSAEIRQILEMDTEKLLKKQWEYPPEGIDQKELRGAMQRGEIALFRLTQKIQDARMEKKYAEAEKLAEQKNKEIISDVVEKIEAWKVQELAKKAEAERQEAAKKAQIEKWVAEKATENQQKRYEIGLLSEAEIADAIRDEAYRVLDAFPRFEKIQDSEVCTCTECDVDYEMRKAVEATAEEYEALEKIADVVKKAHPDTVVTMMDHVGTSEDCGNEVVRKSVKVEIVVGAFRFSREYAI